MDGKDGDCDGENLCDSCDGDECKIRAVVAKADVIAEPWAVMVEATNAVVASGAMTGSWRTPDTAGIAVLDCDISAFVHESSFSDSGSCNMRGGSAVGTRYDTRIGCSGEIGGPDGDGEGDNDSDEKGDGECGMVTKHPGE